MEFFTNVVILVYSLWMYPQCVDGLNKILAHQKKPDRFSGLVPTLFVLVWLFSHIPIYLMVWIIELIVDMFQAK